MVELAVIIGVAALLSVLMRMLKQPVILAYLVAGLLLGGFGFHHVTDHVAFGLFSELGIVLLLFLVGLEINYSSLRTVGPPAILGGLGQVVITFLLGWAIAGLMGFSLLTGAYVAIALTFSSTIIIVKLLSEKRDLDSLYGKMSIGFMLVQDIVAILLLITLGGIEQGQGIQVSHLVLTVVKGVVLFGVMIWVGRKIIPHLFDRIARSGELMFILTLAWVFGVVSIVDWLGFSVEIGGLLAGLALANSIEHYQIASRMRPLRDFFLMIFFVLLGSSLAVFDLQGIGLPVIIFSLFVLIGNPLIVLAIMGAMGYRRRTSFLAGVTIAQISEFSLILAAMGNRLGHINQSTVSLITWVGVITILVSTYLILHAEKIYSKIHHLLIVFERVETSEPTLPDSETARQFVLIGASRIGSVILQHLPIKQTLVIDFDPMVVEQLRKRGIASLLGDISDRDILEEAHLQKASMVISTSPDFQDTLALMAYLQGFSKRPRIIVRAENHTDAKTLYRKGADYVIVPQLTSGHYIGEILGDASKRDRSLWHAREKDFKIMRRNGL